MARPSRTSQTSTIPSWSPRSAMCDGSHGMTSKSSSWAAPARLRVRKPLIRHRARGPTGNARLEDLDRQGSNGRLRERPGVPREP
eukprot:3657568-Alexandrium_andersonii.AAC.1